MKRNLIFGYSFLTVTIITAIIVGVLAGLGYFIPKGSSGGPVFPAGTNTDLTEIQLTEIKPMWGTKISGGLNSLLGVQYRAFTVCQVTACQVEIVATYLYPDGTTDVTTRTFGNSGYYHNPTNNPTKIPLSVRLDAYSISKGQRWLQSSYTVNI